MNRLWLVVLSVCALALVACGGDAPTDSPIASEPNGTRIVSLSPAASKILIDLGLGGSIVGRHNYDRAVSADVPPVGDQTAIDYERLLGLAPTHVVVQTESRDLPERLTELAESTGFELLDIRTLTLGDVEQATRELESVFAPGNGLADRLGASIAPRAEDRSAWGSVLVVMHTAPTVDVLGPGSSHQELIERLGYTPAIAEGLPYMPIDAEDVLALDPGVIVLVRPRAIGAPPAVRDWRAGDDDLGSLAGIGLRAVERGRVVLIDDPLALVPSTSFIAVSAELARRLEAIGPLGSQHDDPADPDTEAGPG